MKCLTPPLHRELHGSTLEDWHEKLVEYSATLSGQHSPKPPETLREDEESIQSDFNESEHVVKAAPFEKLVSYTSSFLARRAKNSRDHLKNDQFESEEFHESQDVLQSLIASGRISETEMNDILSELQQYRNGKE